MECGGEVLADSLGPSLWPDLAALIEANGHYAASDPELPRGPEPRRRIALITCMDVRIPPLISLGLHLGDAHVLRNAGARVTEDTLRSLAVSQQALGTDTVILMPHTLCGLTGLDPAGWEDRLPAVRAPMEFLAVADPVATCLEDLRTLAKNPWMRTGTRYLGLLFDVESGRVKVLGFHGG